MTMLAVARLGENAFAKVVREELEVATGRELAVSTVYVTLVRLDEGWAELQHAREVMARLWEGVKPA
jgi:hypothetical protein